MNSSAPYALSIVVTLYNEERHIPLLYESLKYQLENLGREFEIIFVDDGSCDGTEALLQAIQSRDSAVSYLRMPKRAGQTKALVRSLKVAQHQIIITLDADLQHNPSYIGAFLAKIDEGYDVVLGWRKEREGGQLLRSICSSVGNNIINLLFHVRFRDVATSFRAFKKELLTDKKLYNGYHRFLPVLFDNAAHICEFPIVLRRRKFGRSHYSPLKIFECTASVIHLLFFDKYAAHGILHNYS